MSGLFESLEPRQLFSGGVDASFGSTTGAHFVAPGNSPVILDRNVDSDGRIVLVGTTTKTVNALSQPEMFMARFTANGQLDPKFGINGIVEGTPGGISTLSSIVRLPDGEYIGGENLPIVQFAGGNLPNVLNRIVRFRANGAIDKSFGRNGVLAVPMGSSIHLLVQSDGKLIVVGNDPTNFLAFRYTADGLLDSTYGTSGKTILSPDGIQEGNNSTNFTLSSVALDSSDRLLVSFSGNTIERDEFQTPTGGSVTIFLKRFISTGAFDATFTDGTDTTGSFIYVKRSNTGEAQPQREGVSVTRADGQIAILSRTLTSDDPLTVELIGANGLIGNSPVTAALSTLATGFVVDGLADGAMTALADNTLVIAGTIKNGSTRTPALVRLNANLTLDTAFGQNGIMLLPTTGGAEEASDVSINTDGTLLVLDTGARVNSLRPGDVRITRVFRDDNPVIALAGAKQVGANERITVSIRGVNPIDSSSLDDNDLRLVDGNDVRKKLRLIGSVDTGNGTLLATYRISQSLLSAGTYTVRAIASQVEDTSHNFNTSRALGTIVI